MPEALTVYKIPDFGAEVRLYPDLEHLSRAAADIFTERAARALAAQGRFSVALSGGRTPERTFELLAQSPRRDRVDWAQVHVFWGDERCVPAADPRHNARLAKEAWLNKVPIPEAQVHPIICPELPGEAALAYEGLLRRFLSSRKAAFDLVVLGCGADGHTASLFPGQPALRERERWAVAVPHGAPDGLVRVTLTPVIFNRARFVMFLVVGPDKTRILKEVLEGPHDPERLPAQLIRPRKGKLIWLADRVAAAALERASNRHD